MLRANFCSPLTLAFAFGIFARVIRSELAPPRDLYASLSFYLLFAIGLRGGVELSHSNPLDLAFPAIATLLTGCITPLTSWLVLRRIGRFSISDAAGIAAHYGSVSAVTFVAAQQFAASRGLSWRVTCRHCWRCWRFPAFRSIGLGLWQLRREQCRRESRPGLEGDSGGRSGQSARAVLHELLTGRSLLLLVGGLLIGLVAGAEGCKPVQPLFDGLFRGALTLFLLEMGLTAGAKLSDLPLVGVFLVAFGILVPIAHGCPGVWLGSLAGLSTGGCMVLGTMASSASCIAAPPAVRMSLPEANPAFSLTAALAITFPFNLLFGIPLYHHVAAMIASQTVAYD
ncbi:MAG: sodium-dependent bicarbonate transport family permease [Planctomycetaceae bacterium]